MTDQQFQHFFSEARTKRYLIAANNDTFRAQHLYKANLRLAQAFHPLLGVLEVVLRNTLNVTLGVYFADTDWIINQKSGFMIDPTLTFRNRQSRQMVTNDFLLREVQKAERKLRKAGIVVTTGKLIAEQTLGFWVDFFVVHHYRLLRGRPIQIFNFLPSGHGRKEVHDELDAIRRFRNRINHNEPICFVGGTVDFAEAVRAHQAILDVLGWLDPQLVQFVGSLDYVAQEINSIRII